MSRAFDLLKYCVEGNVRERTGQTGGKLVALHTGLMGGIFLDDSFVDQQFRSMQLASGSIGHEPP